MFLDGYARRLARVVLCHRTQIGGPYHAQSDDQKLKVPPEEQRACLGGREAGFAGLAGTR